jgi:hypothetical protein
MSVAPWQVGVAVLEVVEQPVQVVHRPCRIGHQGTHLVPVPGRQSRTHPRFAVVSQRSRSDEYAPQQVVQDVERDARADESRQQRHPDGGEEGLPVGRGTEGEVDRQRDQRDVRPDEGHQQDLGSIVQEAEARKPVV